MVRKKERNIMEIDYRGRYETETFIRRVVPQLASLGPILRPPACPSSRQFASSEQGMWFRQVGCLAPGLAPPSGRNCPLQRALMRHCL